jgi:hypothetical protein
MASVEVLIQKTAAGALDEVINKADEFKKVKTRKLKGTYRNAMKDPSRYSQTRMADNDHAPLSVRTGDDITFFHSVAFRVSFSRDPEIEEDLSSDDTPMLLAGTPVSGQNATDTTVAGPKRFKAGPFTRNPDAKDQQFYKFTIVTSEFLVLDPDIIVD